jgi:citrate lyase subunit beta/citryl-CoA lyase
MSKDTGPAAAAVTWLFVPGDTPERFAKAATSGAGAVILDLEDAVAPQAKVSARTAVADYLSDGKSGFVRVNGANSHWYAEDMAAIAGLDGLRGVVLPKAETTTQILDAARAMGDRGALVALIETARGVLEAAAIAACGRVARLAFGSVDLALDTNVEDEDAGFLAARSNLVLASRAAGLPGPIDGVTLDVSDGERAGRDAVRARRLGFAGKLCVHPRQLLAVREAFAPGADEVAWADRVMEAVGASGAGVVTVDGEMIDRPRVARAEAILARLASAGAAGTS